MTRIANPFENHQALNQLLVPDLWQHDAIKHLREGHDVIVSAPTGAGKTLIFERWSHDGRPKGRAVYTVPTRALANDKMAEWRRRGWNVGIATGDLAENLSAPIIVATLEAQKQRLLTGDAPDLLVVDEYQMIGDPDRGLNYELAIAQTPPTTQLLLLSGSVNNPQHVEQWLTRLGRRARTIQHDQRPVPLEEVFPLHLHHALPQQIKSYWPRFIAKALAEDLGPVLIFAPRRAAAEKLAMEITRQLPAPHPLELTNEQKHFLDAPLTKALTARVAYHHSGLSYAARAGIIEPLAKTGQLRVVVATMGLAAGINFSLRSVALAAETYRRQHIEQSLRPDEILQMLGRAGRRGIDETGFVLVCANQVRLRDGFRVDLSRTQLIDWSRLLAIMANAADLQQSPYAAAVAVQERLFTTQPISLGVESVLKFPETPCRLKTDSERARFVRSRQKQFLNSHGDWDNWSDPVVTPLAEVLTSPKKGRTQPKGSRGGPKLIPLLSRRDLVSQIVGGNLVRLDSQAGYPIYGSSIKVADQLEKGRLLLTKRLRKMIQWKGRYVSSSRWDEKLVPLIERTLEALGTPLVRFQHRDHEVYIQSRLDDYPVSATQDRHGKAIWNPPIREVSQPECHHCPLTEQCNRLSTRTGTALQWRRLGLTNELGEPTRRGRIVSFFGQTDGLAIAASIEDETYPLNDLAFDLADLDGGFRFSGDDDRWGGRIALACRKMYGSVSIEGYLENGLPINYGCGASQIVRSLHRNPQGKHHWTSDLLGVGDIDRILIEWRSRLRQIASCPGLGWHRWDQFQITARSVLNETESPTKTELPPLTHSQKQRINHRLQPRHWKT